MHPTRREFFGSCALALSAAPSAFAAKPAFTFPTAPAERLAVASYSFRSLIDTPRNRTRTPATDAPLIALKDFPAVIARRYNVHGVELLGQHFPSVEPEYLAELRAALKAANSRLVNLPTSVGASFYDPDPARRNLAIANAKKWVDTAVALDCHSLRVHIQGGKDFAPNVNLAADALLPVAAYGEKNSVVIHLENDDPTTEDAFFLAKVLDRANSPWLRALPDFCNSMLKGDEKFNYDAVAAMFRRAYAISHVKDSEVDNGKTFRVDLARTFQIARETGYKGYFSIEWEGAGDVWEENAKLIEQSIRLMA